MELQIFQAIIIIGLIALVFIALDIKRTVELPERIFLPVFLVLRSREEPCNRQKQWLLEGHFTFRTVPRVGDTLQTWNSDFHVVTEVILKNDKSVSVWCDVDVPESDLDDVASRQQELGWTIKVPEPHFHHAVEANGRLKWRRGNNTIDRQ